MYNGEIRSRDQGDEQYAKFSISEQSGQIVKFLEKKIFRKLKLKMHKIERSGENITRMLKLVSTLSLLQKISILLFSIFLKNFLMYPGVNTSSVFLIGFTLCISFQISFNFFLENFTKKNPFLSVLFFAIDTLLLLGLYWKLFNIEGYFFFYRKIIFFNSVFLDIVILTFVILHLPLYSYILFFINFFLSFGTFLIFFPGKIFHHFLNFFIFTIFQIISCLILSTKISSLKKKIDDNSGMILTTDCFNLATSGLFTPTIKSLIDIIDFIQKLI